ncbi:MAG: hypothetical protein NVS2B17_26050 [Candidatus Velthaea sp.]
MYAGDFENANGTSIRIVFPRSEGAMRLIQRWSAQNTRLWFDVAFTSMPNDDTGFLRRERRLRIVAGDVYAEL